MDNSLILCYNVLFWRLTGHPFRGLESDKFATLSREPALAPDGSPCSLFFFSRLTGHPVRFIFFKNKISSHICGIIINTMKKGTVKFFNESKGFGFIKDEESGKEYFVHVTGLIDEIRENDEVSFELQDGRKGLNAVNVKQA